jgi:DNA-binding transcriptional LysR family regulator
MALRPGLDKIELHLVRVLHVLITERSVSRAALKLQSSQPAVSAQLKRLRELTGDTLLVRAGAGMAPTDTALALVEPAANLLREAERLFAPGAHAGAKAAFDPSRCRATFRIAASDYLDPLFLPELVARVQRRAPAASLLLHSLSDEFDYRRQLAAGAVDLVIGNWLEPPGELHLGQLVSDEVVCLVADDHPATRRKSWTLDDYLACDHVAPMPMFAGARGVIDEHLAARRLQRRIAVRASHFGLIPLMVADSLLVLTTGRLFCQRYTGAMPVTVVPCPVTFPPMNYYQLWHDVTHASPALRWLREQVREVARGLGTHALPRRSGTRPS